MNAPKEKAQAFEGLLGWSASDRTRRPGLSF